MSVIISTVPTSEVRLLNEGLIPLYQGFRGVKESLETIAEQHNITLPQCPPIDSDYRVESQINRPVLHSALTAELAPPPKAMADMMDKVATGAGANKYHWSSLVACLCVPSDSVITQTARAISSATTTPHSLFTNALGSTKMLSACKVIMEELARLKNGASETGWREEEARGLVEEHFRIAEQLASIGNLCEE